MKDYKQIEARAGEHKYSASIPKYLIEENLDIMIDTIEKTIQYRYKDKCNKEELQELINDALRQLEI